MEREEGDEGSIANGKLGGRVRVIYAPPSSHLCESLAACDESREKRKETKIWPELTRPAQPGGGAGRYEHACERAAQTMGAYWVNHARRKFLRIEAIDVLSPGFYGRLLRILP